jgi:uncharacterized protein (DUF1501 family)
MNRLNRRNFLGLSAGASVLAFGAPALAATFDAPKRLIVVMLRGAVDGLNVVIPYGDEAYYAARPTISVGKPGGDDGGLVLDDQFALHPALSGIMPLWQQKQLAFVHAAGLSDPTRSHFDAQLFIESGTPGHCGTNDGWMNRLLAALPGPHGPTDAIAVGPLLPQILKGKMAAANLPLGPTATKPLAIDKPDISAHFDRLYAGNDSQSRTYRDGRAARAELIAGMPMEQQPADGGAALPNTLPTQAAQLAHLLTHNSRIRLVFIGLGGWDTHVQQGNHKGQLADRLRPLGDGLAALASGLGDQWNDTIVVVISEFGRTVKENGDGGTDHGHGNVIWLAGGQVRGGHVYGDWPGLATAQLFEGRDLAVTTDYRHVLASVVERHLRLPGRALDQIFPGLPPARSDLGQIVAT